MRFVRILTLSAAILVIASVAAQAAVLFIFNIARKTAGLTRLRKAVIAVGG